MNGLFSFRPRATRGMLACVAMLGALGASPALGQIRFEFRPPQIQAPPRTVVVPPRVSQPRTYKFGGRSHVDALAAQLERQANAVCLEMYRNYRRNPGYRETYREMYTVLQDAKHIHELVHDHYHEQRHDTDDHIAEDLYHMDELVHHIEDDIRGWVSDRRYHDQTHFYPRSGDSLQRLMSEFTDTLHHLMEDYGVRRRISGNDGEAPPPEDDLVAPPPPGGPLPSRPRRP